MKRTLLIFLIIFVLMQFIRPSKVNEDVDKRLELKASPEIETIFRKACYDCHSNEVNYPFYADIAPFSWVVSNHVNEGVKALNFSKWEEYKAYEKSEKLKAIHRTAYIAMPLPAYTWLHKDAKLTKEERTLIRNWTGVRAK